HRLPSPKASRIPRRSRMAAGCDLSRTLRNTPPSWHGSRVPKSNRSAGLLMFRRSRGELEVLLAHPGGPFWRDKDRASWPVPKGEYSDNEDPLAAARREF